MALLKTQFYSSCTPPGMAGDTILIGVNQTLKNGSNDLLKIESPVPKVQVKIDGPQFKLTPADIAGVYPAPGSEESADEFLPHIALTSRTLPWERHGHQVTNPPKPWLALVLFRESELRDGENLNQSKAGTLSAKTLGDLVADDLAAYNAIAPKVSGTVAEKNKTPLNVLFVKNKIWNQARPYPEDLPYLQHIRQSTYGLQDNYTSIVISNRLPYAGAADEPSELHTAFLISLEGRADLFNRPNNDASCALVVLHHWQFRPSKGGDFEQVMRAIGFRPNGGVLRFGNLPQAPAAGEAAPLSGGFDGLLDVYGYFREDLPHTQPGNFMWRGPLRPFKAAPRGAGFAIRPAPEEFTDADPGTPLDYSHATAFEIGRLMALANTGILSDLRDIKSKFQTIEPPKAINKLPDALQWPEWVSNPQWFEQPWESMVKDHDAFLDKGQVDVGGISEQVAQWGNIVLGELGQMGTPVAQPVVAIDINNVNATQLGKTFAELDVAAGA